MFGLKGDISCIERSNLGEDLLELGQIRFCHGLIPIVNKNIPLRVKK
jgi:hypothetical protein